jgi:hypothetical protein
MREAIEGRIRVALATETSAVALSNQLFAPGGLFSQLAISEEERGALTESPLFREAQARVTELERAERAELVAAVRRMKVARQAAAAVGHPEQGTNGATSPVDGATAKHPARTDTPS